MAYDNKGIEATLYKQATSAYLVFVASFYMRRIMGITFKTDRIKEEWRELDRRNPKLTGVLNCLSNFVTLEFQKDVVITCIFRSEAENEALYAETPPDKRPPTSPHMTWHAADLRSSIYTEQEINKMLQFLNSFSYAGGQRKVALYHIIAGNSFHLHVQAG